MRHTMLSCKHIQTYEWTPTHLGSLPLSEVRCCRVCRWIEFHKKRCIYLKLNVNPFHFCFRFPCFRYLLYFVADVISISSSVVCPLARFSSDFLFAFFTCLLTFIFLLAESQFIIFNCCQFGGNKVSSGMYAY